MTIRKRLLISNILMLAIPDLLSLLALAAAVLLWVSIALPDSGYRLLSRDELGETRGELVALAGDWLAEPNADRRGELMDQITRLSEQNRMALVLEQGGTELCRVGSSAAAGQTQLAEALEVSRQTIGSLENGRYNPSILLAFKIARYFGLTIEDIFIYEEDGT